MLNRRNNTARSGLGVEVDIELVRDLPAGHPGSEPEEDRELFVRVVCLNDMLTVSQTQTQTMSRLPIFLSSLTRVSDSGSWQMQCSAIMLISLY